MHTSSHKPRPKLPPSKNPTLRNLVINFQSLRNKGKLLECVKFNTPAFYRPPNKTDTDYLQTVKNELSQLKARCKKTPLLTGGDFNLPDIHWKDLTVASSQYASRVNTTFLKTIADCNLEQLVDFPTRKDHTLDIILTTHPSFKQRCKPIPSIGSSDHDIFLLDMYSTARRPKPIPRKIHLW